MNIVQNILLKLLYLLQVFLVLIYIVLEELIWEQFAKRIFRYLKYLKLFERLEEFLSHQNRYTILFLFLIILVIAEFMGIATPIIMLKGHILLAVLVYGVKLLLAAFAFWMLNTQKSKLLSFAWFAYLYKQVIAIKERIVTSEIYKSVLVQIRKIKTYFKIKYIEFKNFLLNRLWR